MAGTRLGRRSASLHAFLLPGPARTIIAPGFTNHDMLPTASANEPTRGDG